MYKKFYNYAYKKFEDDKITEYATLFFIKDLIKNKNPLYFAIEESVNFFLKKKFLVGLQNRRRYKMSIHRQRSKQGK